MMIHSETAKMAKETIPCQARNWVPRAVAHAEEPKPEISNRITSTARIAVMS